MNEKNNMAVKMNAVAGMKFSVWVDAYLMVNAIVGKMNAAPIDKGIA